MSDRPGAPVCTASDPDGSSYLYSGTNTQQSFLPGPQRSDGVSKVELLQSETISASLDSATATVGQLSYDAFIRKYVYDPAAKAISEQGDEFVRKGFLSKAKAAEWVNAQRNALLISIRDSKNTPLGRSISEYLKPRDTLPTVDDLMKKPSNAGKPAEEVYEAIIKSGGRTRGSVNKLAMAFRWAGPAMLVVNIGMSAYLVHEAPPGEKGRVIFREAGGLVGGGGGGLGGAWLGCKAGAAVGVWFEGVGAVPGCAIGALIGGIGGGYAGSVAGSWMGEKAFDFSESTIEWIREP